MEAELSSNRVAPRLTPRNPVTVAVQDGEDSVAYGVVTNLSETGACVVTDTHLGSGRLVLLRISFYRQNNLFETEARIVWSDVEAGAREGLPTTVFQGIQFTSLSEGQQAWLRQLLGSPEFVRGKVLSVTPEFEDLVSALRQDLKRLGSKMKRSTERSSGSD